MGEKHAAEASLARVASTPPHERFGQDYIEIDAHWRDAHGRSHGATIRMSVSDLGWLVTGRMGVECELEVMA